MNESHKYLYLKKAWTCEVLLKYFFLNDEMSQLHKKLSLFLYSNIKSWKMKKNYLLLGKETVSASLQQVNIIFSKLVLNWNITHQLLPYEEKA